MHFTKPHMIAAAIAVGFLALGAIAADSSSQESRPGPGKNPAIDAAIKECMSSTAKDSNGRPDRTAVDACMKSKGFTPPPHHGRGGRGQPPADGQGQPPAEPPQN